MGALVFGAAGVWGIGYRRDLARPVPRLWTNRSSRSIRSSAGSSGCSSGSTRSWRSSAPSFSPAGCRPTGTRQMLWMLPLVFLAFSSTLTVSLSGERWWRSSGTLPATLADSRRSFAHRHRSFARRGIARPFLFGTARACYNSRASLAYRLETGDVFHDSLTLSAARRRSSHPLFAPDPGVVQRAADQRCLRRAQPDGGCRARAAARRAPPARRSTSRSKRLVRSTSGS